jgi:hypothetical protein
VRRLLISVVLVALSMPMPAPAGDGRARGLPTTDQAFAARVLASARAGRPVTEVLDELRAGGFTCLEHDDRVLSGPSGPVRLQRHVCGGAVPALHGCARNAELTAFDGVLKHVRLSFEHPDGTPNEGVACAR